MLQPVSQAKLKLLRSLTRPKGRDEEGAFIAEGVRIVSDGLTAKLHPRVVLFDDTLLATKPELEELAKRAGETACTTDPKTFAEFSDTVNSQGVLAVFDMPKLSPRDSLGLAHSTFLVLDNVRDPGNTGTLIRHAAAFDCSGIFLLKGCCDPFNEKAVRASMGGVFTMPLECDCDPGELVAMFSQHQVWPYVLDNAPGAASALSIGYAPKTAFVIGGEADGVGPYWDEAQVIKVVIPQTERVESLNAAIAASIMLAHRYHALTQARRR